MILGGLGHNFHVDLGVFGTQTCSLACLVAALWRPGGPWGDPWTLGRTLGGPDLDFIVFSLISGTHFESFLGTFGPKKMFFSCLSPGFFFW